MCEKAIERLMEEADGYPEMMMITVLRKDVLDVLHLIELQRVEIKELKKKLNGKNNPTSD